MRFKLYDLKSEYIKQLGIINSEMCFLSKKYSKIINGKRQHFVADRVMTRTWANENPRETKEKKFILPIPKFIEVDFEKGELVEYDKNWYPEEDLVNKL